MIMNGVLSEQNEKKHLRWRIVETGSSGGRGKGTESVTRSHIFRRRADEHLFLEVLVADKTPDQHQQSALCNSTSLVKQYFIFLHLDP